MSFKKHPDKEIRKAIDDALEQGWRFIESGQSLLNTGNRLTLFAGFIVRKRVGRDAKYRYGERPGTVSFMPGR